MGTEVYETTPTPPSPLCSDAPAASTAIRTSGAADVAQQLPARSCANLIQKIDELTDRSISGGVDEDASVSTDADAADPSDASGTADAPDASEIDYQPEQGVK